MYKRKGLIQLSHLINCAVPSTSAGETFSSLCRPFGCGLHIE